MSMSLLEYHVLLALADEARHGFAIADRVAVDSDGTLRPRAGSLYRVIARLIDQGWIEESAGGDEAPHPGLPRRYYTLTGAGRRTLANEATRLRASATVALKRLARS